MCLSVTEVLQDRWTDLVHIYGMIGMTLAGELIYIAWYWVKIQGHRGKIYIFRNCEKFDELQWQNIFLIMCPKIIFWNRIFCLVFFLGNLLLRVILSHSLRRHTLKWSFSDKQNLVTNIITSNSTRGQVIRVIKSKFSTLRIWIQTLHRHFFEFFIKFSLILAL